MGIKGISGIRILNRYDIQGLDDSIYAVAKYGIFAEIQTDNVYEEAVDFDGYEHIFAYEYLPGQYDQRADSCEQCIQLISHHRPIVKTAKLVCIFGDIKNTDIDKIKEYIINPVECRIASMEKPDNLKSHYNVPDMVETVSGFTKSGKDAIVKMKNQCGFAMSEEDLLFVQEYFKSLDRDPTITELKVIDTYWSDHCRHTTFNTVIEDVLIEEDIYNEKCKKTYDRYLEIRKEIYKDKDKPICLMDIATIGAKYLKNKGLLNDMEESKKIMHVRLSLMYLQAKAMKNGLLCLKMKHIIILLKVNSLVVRLLVLVVL